MKLVKYCLVFIVFFLLVSSPAIFGFQSTGLALSVILSFYTLFWIIYRRQIDKELIIAIFSFLPIISYLLLIFMVSNGTDGEMLRRVSTIVFSVLGCYAFVLICKSMFPRWKIKDYLFLFFVIALCHSVILLLQYMSYDFRSVTYSITGFSQENLRMAGLYLAAGDGVSLNIVLLFIPFLAAYFCKAHRFSYYLFFVAILCVLLTSLSGRTGAFIAPLVLIIAYFMCSKGSQQLIARFFTFSTLLAIGVFLTAYIILPVLIEASLDTSRGFNDPIVRLLQPLRTYALDGSANISSLEALSGRMLIFPTTLPHLLFGNGEFGREGLVYVSSDIGYIRMIFGMGLIGVSLFLLPLIATSIRVFMGQRKVGLILASVFIFGVFANFKIVYLPTVIFTNVFFLIYFLSYKVESD